MTKNASFQTPQTRRWKFFRSIALAFILIILGFTFGQQHATRYIVEKSLSFLAPQLGFQFVEAQISGHLGAPIILENIRFGRLSNAPAESQTAITIRRAEVTLRPLWEIVMDRSKLIRRLRIDGAFVLLDYRSQSFPYSSSEVRIWKKELIPQTIEVNDAEVDILAPNQRYRLAGIRAQLLENALGSISINNLSLQAGPMHRTIKEVKGRTAWKDGVLFLSGISLGRGVEVHNFVANLLRQEGIALSIEGVAYGGWLRATAAFGKQNGKPTIDTTLWAQQLSLPAIAADFNQTHIEKGIVQDARITFRGTPEDAIDGDWILRLTINDLNDTERSIQKFEVGATLNNRFFTLSTFELIQEENDIKCSGNARLSHSNTHAKSSDKLTAVQSLSASQTPLNIFFHTFAPFLSSTDNVALRMDAKINNLAALIRLLNTQNPSFTGRAQIQAEIKGENGQLTGTIEAKGEKLTYKQTALGNFNLLAVLNGLEATLQRCEFEQNKDALTTTATINLQYPYHYSANLSAQVADLSHYRRLFSKSTTPSGEVILHWQGDGNTESHSGAFNIALHQVQCHPAIPQAINAQVSGTYSPDNIYLSQLELLRNKLSLTSNLSAGSEGIYFSNLSVKSAHTELLSGEIYLPWDPHCLLLGKPWQSGLKESKEIYASLLGNKLPLRNLAAIIGQTLAIDADAQLKIQASGSLAAPNISGFLGLRNVRIGDNASSIVLSDAKLQMDASAGTADINGQFVATSPQPITLSAVFPFGMTFSKNKHPTFLNPTENLTATLLLPETELSQFRSLLPNTKILLGTIDGKVHVKSHQNSQEANGFLKIRNGSLELNQTLPKLAGLNIGLNFDNHRLQISNCKGTLGSGPFDLSGEIKYADFQNPEFNITFSGQDILLVRNATILLRSDINLQLHGDKKSGSVIGDFHLQNSRITKRPEVIPLIVGHNSMGMHIPFLLPTLKGYIPPPFANWTLNVRISNGTPFSITDPIAAGVIEPDIAVTGSLGDPRPTGNITLRNIKVALPSATVIDIPDGHIYLRKEHPRNPVIDIEGEVHAGIHSVHLYAYGPMEERNLVLYSNPPLTQEAILHLLTSDSQKHPVDIDTFPPHYHLQGISPPIQNNPLTLSGEIRITDCWRLITEREDFQYLNNKLSYIFRFN